MQKKKDMLGLINTLSYKHQYVRSAAAKALAEIGASAVQSLCTALEDKNEYVRFYAADVLGEIGDASAIVSLIDALKDDERIVRKAAAEALGKIGDEQAVEPLIARLKDKEGNVHRAATVALIEIRGPAVKHLCAALKDEDKYVREVAANALGEIGYKRAAKPLEGVLKDDEQSVRKAAADALEKIGLSDDTSAQAWYAVVKGDWTRAISLGSVSIEPITFMLKHGHMTPTMRSNAANALKKIGLPADQEVEAWYAVASGNWSRMLSLDSVAIEPLITALDWDSKACKAAAETIRKISIKHEDKSLFAPAADILVSILIKDENKGVRFDAAKALGSIGAPVVESLIVALKHKNADVREAAAIALGDIGDLRSVEPLLSMLEVRIPSERDLRYQVVNSLGQIGAQLEDVALRKCVVEKLVPLLRDGHWLPEVDRAAVAALVRIGEPALESLIAVLMDDNKGYEERQRAAEALADLYREEKISEKDKQKILAMQDTIPASHFDIGTCRHDDIVIRLEL